MHWQRTFNPISNSLKLTLLHIAGVQGSYIVRRLRTGDSNDDLNVNGIMDYGCVSQCHKQRIGKDRHGFQCQVHWSSSSDRLQLATVQVQTRL